MCIPQCILKTPRWRIGLERWHRKRKVDVQISARQTLVVKTGSESSTTKRSIIGASVIGPRR